MLLICFSVDNPDSLENVPYKVSFAYLEDEDGGDLTAPAIVGSRSETFLSPSTVCSCGLQA